MEVAGDPQSLLRHRALGRPLREPRFIRVALPATALHGPDQSCRHPDQPGQDHRQEQEQAVRVEDECRDDRDRSEKGERNPCARRWARGSIEGCHTCQRKSRSRRAPHLQG